MALRLTQENVEILQQGDPNARLTQVVVEILQGSGDPTETSYGEYSRNQLTPGTSEDLEHADWTASNATVDDATTFTPTDADGGVTIEFTGVSGITYTVSATIASDGNTDLEWVLGAGTDPVTVTASEVRYETTFTGTGAAQDIGLQDPNVDSFDAITFTEIQIEVGDTASTYTDPSNPILVVRFDGVDDIIQVVDPTLFAFAGDQTYIFAFRAVSIDVGDRIIHKGGATGVTQIDIYLQADNIIRAYIEDDAANSVAANVITHASIADQEWHLGALTVEYGVEMIGFLDGSQEDTADISSIVGSIIDTTNPLIFGADENFANNFQGDMALIALYNCLLTPTDIATATLDIAQTMWDKRQIAFRGVSGVDFTVAPTG